MVCGRPSLQSSNPTYAVPVPQLLLIFGILGRRVSAAAFSGVLKRNELKDYPTSIVISAVSLFGRKSRLPQSLHMRTGNFVPRSRYVTTHWHTGTISTYLETTHALSITALLPLLMIRVLVPDMLPTLTRLPSPPSSWLDSLKTTYHHLSRRLRVTGRPHQLDDTVALIILHQVPVKLKATNVLRQTRARPLAVQCSTRRAARNRFDDVDFTGSALLI